MTRPHENYSLESKPLGRGGQAEVFRALDKSKNEYVAFKRILKENRNNKEALERMKREIEVQTHCSHPNIMPILDYSQSHCWYTMPIAERTMMDIELPIKKWLLLTILEEISAGLEYAHKLDYIHRDVNPRNVLKIKINEYESRWVLSDWGLVRRIGQTSVVMTQHNVPYGMPGFAAPEMGDNAHSVNEQVDVYSLGRLAAWSTTNKWPIKNVPLNDLGVFQEFIQKTTELYPEDRTKNIEEVLNMLSDLRELFVRKNYPEDFR